MAKPGIKQAQGNGQLFRAGLLAGWRCERCNDDRGPFAAVTFAQAMGFEDQADEHGDGIYSCERCIPMVKVALRFEADRAALEHGPR